MGLVKWIYYGSTFVERRLNLNIMKLYILICLFALTSCSAIQPSADHPKLGETTWKLIAIEQRSVSYGDRAFVKFDEKENKISGKAACNSFSSEYEMAGQKIAFSDISSTKMYCEGIMDDENQIMTQLRSTNRYEVKSDMLYFYAEQKLVLTFKR